MWEVIFCISWVYFSTMQYHSLRRFPVPLVSTGIYSGKRLSDAGGLYQRVPFRESSERGRVRKGETGK